MTVRVTPVVQLPQLIWREDQRDAMRVGGGGCPCHGRILAYGHNGQQAHFFACLRPEEMSIMHMPTGAPEGEPRRRVPATAPALTTTSFSGAGNGCSGPYHIALRLAARPQGRQR